MKGAMKEGLIEKAAIKGGTRAPLRGETNKMSQRPTGTSGTVKDSRGSFKNKGAA